IDNVSDMLLQARARRSAPGSAMDPPQLDAAFLDRPTADAPLAEHGFSALVSVIKGDIIIQ
ncbi:MAG: hypothetical protein IID41_14210, partial [Planctomycetes bacterium]|nr:hypothetical protein [Planctomycetota bacterium]